jgi:hypothetical protein
MRIVLGTKIASTTLLAVLGLPPQLTWYPIFVTEVHVPSAYAIGRKTNLMLKKLPLYEYRTLDTKLKLRMPKWGRVTMVN